MGKLAGYSFLLFAALAVAAFFNRNTFPPELAVDPAALQAPVQESTTEAPVDTNFNGVRYHIEPRYEYEMTGVVVSYRHHDGDSMLHKLWNDHLNSADLCVIWGENLKNPFLNELDFHNGQFTCNVQTRHREAWAHFNMAQLSNNHLISDNNVVRDTIGEVRVGDEVRLRGWLADYSSNGGGSRTTSAVRTDTGNGACEIIYVEDFEILKSMANPWRRLMWVFLLLSLGCGALYIASPYRPK